jgi:predicted MPP superfamily phosphohydrolase
VLCGADYVTGGFGLADPSARPGDFRILLIHDPHRVDDILKNSFSLAFAGHTHGGQLRVPAPSGLVPLTDQGSEFLGGVYPWGDGLLVVSRGVGTSFLPFRLLTRPEATLWRLV